MKWHYSRGELEMMGFKSLGENVLVSRKASIADPANISIGNNVRIDDFVLMTGNIWLRSYIHISAFCSLGGRAGIVMKDYSGLSAGVKVFSASDDYSGAYMTNPTVPEHLTNVTAAVVIFEKHSIVGANSVILPGVEIGVGAAVGALSLVTKDVPEFTIYAGIPAKQIGTRDRKLLALEKRLQ